MPNDYIVKPVHKALQVLLFIGSARRPLTLTEISYQMHIPKTTVFRYLQTLCSHRFVTHDLETDCYQLGLRLWELGQAVGESLRIREIALPLMQELRDRFNETVNLGVIDGREVVYVEIAESNYSLRMRAEIGGRDPIYSTALGKAILAFLPDNQWPQHLPARLTARTTNTLTTLAALRHDLLLTRERGYSLDQGENEDGAYCVGAPIRDHRGRVIAAVSISAPASRLTAERKQEVAMAVMATAAAVSRRSGFDPERSTAH